MPPGAVQPGTMLAAVAPARRKRRWPRRLLIALVILIVLLAGGWIFVGRPILHSVAQNQLDQIIGSQVGTLQPLPAFVTSSLKVTETGLDNLITLNIAPSDPVQNAVAHITPGGVELDFQLFGFACSIKGVPIASNGVVVMTQVQVNGILGLVMSPDEMTTLLNGQIRTAFSNLQRQVTSVVLKNQEMDIQLK
jgi:hypothetical protein